VVAKKVAAAASVDAVDTVDAASSRMHKAALEESTNVYGLVAAAEVAFFNFMMSQSMVGYFSTVNKTSAASTTLALAPSTTHRHHTHPSRTMSSTPCQ
jgi:hypothetical protein